MSTKKQWDNYTFFSELAQEDPNIIGFFLGGWRGKWHVTQYSDYDMYLIFKDEVSESYKKNLQKYQIPENDTLFFSEAEFKNYTFNDGMEWNKYNFAHLTVDIDKKNIQELVDKKCKFEEKDIKKFIEGRVPRFINRVYRSYKHDRNGYTFASRLRAVQTIHCFLEILFALDYRVVPYYKYLEWELDAFPIKKFPLSSDEILENIKKIIETGDVMAQFELLWALEKVLKKEYEDNTLFDFWKIKFNWSIKHT